MATIIKAGDNSSLPALKPVILGEITYQGRHYIALLHSEGYEASIHQEGLEQAKEKCCQMIEKILTNIHDIKEIPTHTDPLHSISAGGVIFSRAGQQKMYDHETLKTTQVWNQLIYLILNPHHAPHIDSRIELIDVSEVTVQNKLTSIQRIYQALGKTSDNALEFKLKITPLEAKILKMIPHDGIASSVKEDLFVLSKKEQIDEAINVLGALMIELKITLEQEGL
ncbi:MAG: hypothetical protein QRY72_01705 [Candidatus Rhabdochlamydia sp.]